MFTISKIKINGICFADVEKGSKQCKKIVNASVNYAIDFLILHGFLRKMVYVSGKILEHWKYVEHHKVFLVSLILQDY